MAITSYSELQSALASWLHRSDLTSEIKDFIALAESDMQVRARIAHWDVTTPVTISGGSGSLPSDFFHAVSVQFGSQTSTLKFLPRAHFDDYLAANGSGEPLVYTVVGASLKVAPAQDGIATLNYSARFVPLSETATTNSLLNMFPDVYLNGALIHAATWLQDDRLASIHMPLFEASISRIRTFMLEQKYPQRLQVRAA